MGSDRAALHEWAFPLGLSEEGRGVVTVHGSEVVEVLEVSQLMAKMMNQNYVSSSWCWRNMLM